MKKNLVLLAIILLLAVGVLAQTHSEVKEVVVIGAPQGISTEKSQTFTYIERIPSFYDPVKPEDMRLYTFMADSSSVVKNAPYTATAVTETTQTLGDGNRIINKTTASLARDGEGRTRREENVVRIGSLQGTGPKLVTLHDPVAHTEYIFQPDGPNGTGKTIFKSRDGIAVKPKVRTFTMSKGDDVHSVQFDTTNDRGTKSYVTFEDKGEQETDVKHESLGTQTIEGVTAEGTRETRTIPAGAIGNEKPIEITSETWTSPDLQTVVLSKRNDPRFGETVYKLTGITRGEPDPALFQPPANLKKVPSGQTKY